MLNKLTVFTTAALLSVGLISSCATPPANIANSNPSPAQATSTSSTIQATDNTEPNVYAENGIALKGFDPVAYFTQGAPTRGSNQFEYEWGGAVWQFSSADNRDLFASNPDQYAPQYGGYCAWAVAQGYVAPIDPNAWAIVDGRLYLNFNQDVQTRWQRDIPGNIAKANSNWPAVLAQ